MVPAFLQQPLVPVGGPTADLEPAGQQALTPEADLDAALHHRVDVQEAFPDLRFRAAVFFIDPHDFADAQGGFPAVFQQLGGGAERQRKLLLGLLELLLGRVLLPLANDEAAADGEERGGMEDGAVGVGDRERHAVGVPGQDGQRAQDNVLDPVGQGDGAGQLQGAGLGDRGEPFLHFLGQDQLRVEALQAEQDGGHGAVAVARGGEGAVEVHPQRRRVRQLAKGFEFRGEDGGSPHGAHGVRTGWSYSDGKEVEDSDSHDAYLPRRKRMMVND